MSPDELIAAEKAHQWHPFTQMEEWCAADHQPLIIERGDGCSLFDSNGLRYLDGNSTIWTNIHGHSHPTITSAVARQLGKIAHVSFLGQTHRPAIELAKKLVSLIDGEPLSRVFFTDDGSTAIECALKMAIQCWQQSGRADKTEILSFDQAYHGDTFGASSIGGIPAFHDRFDQLGLKTHRIRGIEDLEKIPKSTVKRLAAACIEPLIQGAAGMRIWEKGMLRELCEWCEENEVLLILDEVMTGFGRTGTMFAFQQEGIVPDFLCLAKGLTGGTMPLAATMTSESVHSAFLGGRERAFYHGHSYTANPLGCVAALANLQIFEDENTLENLAPKIEYLEAAIGALSSSPNVSAVRNCGFIAAIDLCGADGDALPVEERWGEKVCLRARDLGLLTRPVRDTVVLMLPLSATVDQIDEAIVAIAQSLDVFPGVLD